MTTAEIDTVAGWVTAVGLLAAVWITVYLTCLAIRELT